MDQNAYVSTPSPQPCPVCGVPPEERVWERFVQGTHLRIQSKKHSVIGSLVTPLVCTRCGFVQIFVDPHDYRKGPEL